jgi:cytochrome o ubiquinol oxidase subunit 3
MNHTIPSNHNEEELEDFSKKDRSLFAFWAYIMSDCLLFASLFVTYAVLHNGTFGGVTSKDIFTLPFVLVETLILLTSSFTYGLISLYSHHRHGTKLVLAWISITFILGSMFLAMELSEFATLIGEGNGPSGSAFLSSFFTLLSVHGVHVTVGLTWMGILFVQIWKKGVTDRLRHRLSLLGLFWHFLDIIWIFIFTFVYLMGVL